MMDCVEETTHDPLSVPTQSPPSSTSDIKIDKKPNDNVSLADNSLLVDISDALSEKEKVKFTVHTKTTLPEFRNAEFTVVRQHEEFVWLHDRYEENEDYAGYIIPPAPPRPDFDASREKLQRLGEGEGALTREEFLKMKEELEDEYLATFKKTVAMHEVFLQRLSTHPVFRHDTHLRVFLEYQQDLCAKPRGKMDLIGGLMRSMTTTTDEIYLGATVRDVNDFFEQETTFLQDYYSHLKEAVAKVDRMTYKHKEVADAHIKLSSCITQLATREQPPTERFLTKASDTFDKCRKIEGRMASDQDLKLADTLRYYMRDAHAAKAVLVRRLRCLSAYEAANRNLERARAKNKDVHAAEQAQANACAKFETLSARAGAARLGTGESRHSGKARHSSQCTGRTSVSRDDSAWRAGAPVVRRPLSTVARSAKGRIRPQADISRRTRISHGASVHLVPARLTPRAVTTPLSAHHARPITDVSKILYCNIYTQINK